MFKVIAPNVALRVLDRAIQAHGAAGVSAELLPFQTTERDHQAETAQPAAVDAGWAWEWLHAASTAAQIAVKMRFDIVK